MARGSWRDGSRRSFAVNVTTPNPRKAKNVRATLETMSRTGGYVDGARRAGSMLRMVTTANRLRMPTTIMTMTLWTFATIVEPAMLSAVMTMTSAMARLWAATKFLLANASAAYLPNESATIAVAIKFPEEVLHDVTVAAW